MITRSVVILGTPIDDVTMPEAVERIAEMVADGRATGRAHQVATVNVDFVVNAKHDDEVRRILQRSDLAIPDGMGVLWGARLIGQQIRERTAGVDLVPAICERAAIEGWRVCLFGGAPGVAERAARMLRERHGSDVVGVEAPVVAADGTMDSAALDQLTALDADVVGVALGNPKQERWISRYGSTVGAPVFIGIGGTVDFLTGVTRRAPGWMQRGGLEWVHRALSEPRRLALRYAKDLVVFGPGVATAAWRGRRRGPAVVPLVEEVDGVRTVRLLGTPPGSALHEALDGTVALRIDLSELRRGDNATAAWVAAAVRDARRSNRPIDIVRPPARGIDLAELGEP